MVKLELIAGSRETQAVVIGMRSGSWDLAGGELEGGRGPPNSQSSRVQEKCSQGNTVVVVTSDEESEAK